MQRVGFRLKLKKELLDEYVEQHKNVWPEMLNALQETGWTNYSLFLDRNDGTLFGYFETVDFDAARDGMANQEVNSRWQEKMLPFFEQLEGVNPDQGFHTLEQVFFLQ